MGPIVPKLNSGSVLSVQVIHCMLAYFFFAHLCTPNKCSAQKYVIWNTPWVLEAVVPSHKSSLARFRFM